MSMQPVFTHPALPNVQIPAETLGFALRSEAQINGLQIATSRLSGSGGPLELEVPEFKFCFCAPLTQFRLEGAMGKVTTEAMVDENAYLLMSLNGEWIEKAKDLGELLIHEVFLDIKLLERRPCAEFVASSLWAILSLAQKISIKLSEPGNLPGANITIDLDSDPDHQSLLKISNLLKTRQTAYRLMVIERATEKKFLLTPDGIEQDVMAIAFAYRAMVDRSFVWALDPERITALATQKYLAQLPTKGQPMRYEEQFDHQDLTILGETVSLGRGTIVIEDFFIDNEDKVRRELAMNDGHAVEYVAGSLSGRATFSFPEAPQLPDSPWDQKIQSLIDLESQLDANIVERYHSLAASTLEGLTEEEKIAVTARPRFDEKFPRLKDLYEKVSRFLSDINKKVSANRTRPKLDE